MSSNRRPTFGSRHLTAENDVFEHNAWDNAEWTEEQYEENLNKVKRNSEEKVDNTKKLELEQQASERWNEFYSVHKDKFFKDRHWLLTEFVELLPSDCMKHSEKSSKQLLEFGCGVGNTIIPILMCDKNPDLRVYGCDYSSKAIEVLKQNEHFDSSRCQLFCCDVADQQFSLPIDNISCDFVVLIFVLSSIPPEKMSNVVLNAMRYLKPGGLILFRDYGRYDMSQIRFKKGQCLSDNFYHRGDGTLVYFFTENEVRNLFVNQMGLIEKQIITDKRLLVNRAKLLQMYRVWIQGKFQKPYS